MIRALIAIAVIGGLWIWGSSDAAGDETIFRGIIIGAVICFFPLIYAWNFVRVPAEIDGLKNVAIITANAALEQKAVTKNKALTLSVYIERGHALSAERIAEDEFQDWLSRVDKWSGLGVTLLATNFSHQDAVDFKHVKYHLTENFIYSVNDEHNRTLQQLIAKLEKLKIIASHHEKEWSPISSAERIKINANLAIIEAQGIGSGSKKYMAQHVDFLTH